MVKKLPQNGAKRRTAKSKWHVSTDNQHIKLANSTYFATFLIVEIINPEKNENKEKTQ